MACHGTPGCCKTLPRVPQCSANARRKTIPFLPAWHQVSQHGADKQCPQLVPQLISAVPVLLAVLCCVHTWMGRCRVSSSAQLIPLAAPGATVVCSPGSSCVNPPEAASGRGHTRPSKHRLEAGRGQTVEKTGYCEVRSCTHHPQRLNFSSTGCNQAPKRYGGVP